MSTKVITGITRWAYANVWSPKATKNGKMRYSVRLIISKDDKETMKKISNAITEAIGKDLELVMATNKRGESGLYNFADICKNSPIFDGDERFPNDPTYKNTYYINAASATQPGIVDEFNEPITDHSEVYSGVYGRASISLFYYSKDGNNGIACKLNNLQKTSDGEPLGLRTPTAAEDFG